MRIKELPKEEYEKRVEKLQSLMKKNDLDLIACYSSECESGVIRYFTGFWPFFDFASLLIPREGEPILLTGGPESADFAKVSSKIKNCHCEPGGVATLPDTFRASRSRGRELAKNLPNLPASSTGKREITTDKKGLLLLNS